MLQPHKAKSEANRVFHFGHIMQVSPSHPGFLLSTSRKP